MEIYNGTYCVYVHINKINGKMYVGQTIYGDNPNKRWMNGYGYKECPLFWRAIQKYGWDNFEHEVVASKLTKQEADAFEKRLIECLKTKERDHGYNLTDGGDGSSGFNFSAETRNKLSVARTGKKHTEQVRKKMSDSAKKHKVYQFNGNCELVAIYDSVIEASNKTKIHKKGISQCASKHIPSAGGYVWVFVEDVYTAPQRVDEYKKRKIRREAIVQLTISGEFVCEWKSASEAGRKTGINFRYINEVCRGNRQNAGGYLWLYISDYNNLYCSH